MVMLDDRAMAIFTARVYLAESHRRGKRPFAFVLLEWAANARRRAAMAPVQRRLFG
jgi:hypothetical protein